MSRSVVVLLAMTVAAALQLSTVDAFVAPSSRVQRLSDTSRTFPMSDDEESSTLLADEATTTMSLEDKMKSWEASEEEIRAASLGGVVPGGGGEPRTDAFDIGLYIAFPIMVIGCLALVCAGLGHRRKLIMNFGTATPDETDELFNNRNFQLSTATSPYIRVLICMDSGARLMNMNERGRLNLSKFIMVLVCKLRGQEAVPIPELVGDANSPQSLYDFSSPELVRPPLRSKRPPQIVRLDDVPEERRGLAVLPPAVDVPYLPLGHPSLPLLECESPRGSKGDVFVHPLIFTPGVPLLLGGVHFFHHFRGHLDGLEARRRQRQEDERHDGDDEDDECQPPRPPDRCIHFWSWLSQRLFFRRRCVISMISTLEAWMTGTLDLTFARDAPGFGQPGFLGPFSQAQNGFWRRGVIPLVVGAFGESNTGLLKLLKTWARHAASGDLGATISPLANTDRKGGAFPIMHRQFLRAVGVTAATGNAALKLSRIHYLRSKQHMLPIQTTANIDLITLINAELAGTSAMPMRDMARAQGFYLPGGDPHPYVEGETVKLKVNKMTSEKTLLSEDYYGLPYCTPEGGSKMDRPNLSEFIAGGRIKSSPYRLSMNVDMICEQLCITNLGQGEEKGDSPNKFVRAIRNNYHNNWIVDNIPAVSKIETETMETTFFWKGFHVGFIDKDTKKAYVHNHVNIEIQYHKVETEPDKLRVVRFTVKPFSIKHTFETNANDDDDDYVESFNVADIQNPIESCNKKIANREHTRYEMVHARGRDPQPASGRVLFTYDVIWTENKNLHWTSRWDVYTSAITAEEQWSSIPQSLVIVVLMSAVTAYTCDGLEA
ncbi:hypothetical protein THAOC_02371 [Thalassiosira oceanica]|uniref:Transmembrane 9 superfamily member n=1 Tax=Thalassiosira oceanica TaxID=159749 RepID=K0TM51_THAOC|nr:hypothetical protein THAOC_02371 [Thalassiosira oceanica]|eukprot:EJK75891.1 hypothetical protein THAOC_02371 [Thalassiosira oceanica]